MAKKPYRPKMTEAEKKAYKKRNFGEMGKTGGMGGGYGRKSTNLSEKQLKRAGALKASQKREVSISQTTRDYSRGLTLGPGGKPLTGTVKLANGRTAVYKGGKRVQAGAAAGMKEKPKAPRVIANKDKEKRPSAVTSRVSPSRRGEGAGTSGSSTPKTRQTVNRASAAAMAAAGAPGRRRNPDAAMPYQAAGAKSRLQKQREEAKARQESRGTVQGFFGSITAKPEKGETKETVNSKMMWDGKRWTRTHIKKKAASGKSYWVKL